MYPHRSKSSRSLLSITVAVAFATGLVACSSDAKKATETSASVKATVTTQASPTTVAPTTVAPTTVAPTTVPVTTTTVPATTTTVPGPPVYPLTGVEIADPALAGQVALVVKIDNAPAARPQNGFNEADLVFEEIVNDNLTRFAMVFQSQGSNPVGPIRSGRIQDINLFSALNRPLFAWSGGNATVTAAIRASELIDIGPSRSNVYFRARDRGLPNNLYSSTDTLWTNTPVYAGPPPQQFSYRAPDAPAAGVASPGVAVTLDSINVRWDWDAHAGLYRRMMEGRVHNDASSGQVTTNNVVVLNMEYLPGISDSPDAQTIGTGEAFVFTGGNYIHAKWTRNGLHDPFAITADDGSVVKLHPGRTFIELPRPGNTLALPAS